MGAPRSWVVVVWLAASTGAGCNETSSGLRADAACVRSGCPGPGGYGRRCIAAGESVIDGCILLRTDFCLVGARCERQPSGACGFTMTDALQACLSDGGPRCTGFAPLDPADAGCDDAR